MAWTNQTFSVGQVLTAAQVTNLNNNVTALANGDSGAPKIQTSAYGSASITAAAMGANSVGTSELIAASVRQGEISTATASQSLAIGPLTVGVITPTGGTFTLAYFLGEGGGTQNLAIYGHTTTYSAKVGFYNKNVSSSRTAYLYSRYIQASPPYNLGDGDIPLFVYVLIDNSTGLIIGTSAAKDPHWAYHGNHNITPDRFDKVTGKKYKNVPQFILDGFNLNTALLSNSVDREIALDYLRNKDIVEIELDNVYKNQDMNTAPHPWVGSDLTNKTVLLLDPVSDIVLDLYEIHKQAEFNVESVNTISDLLVNGYLEFNKTPLNRIMPSEVIAVAPKWKISN